MKITGKAIFLLLILALLMVLLTSTLRMSMFSAKLLPQIIIGMIFILAAIVLVRELRKGKPPTGVETTPTEAGTATAVAEEHTGYLGAAIWVGGFFLAIYLLGFIVAIAAFVLAYMKMHDSGWFRSVAYSALTTAVIYGLFQYLMNIGLYPGVIPIMLGIA